MYFVWNGFRDFIKGHWLKMALHLTPLSTTHILSSNTVTILISFRKNQIWIKIKLKNKSFPQILHAKRKWWIFYSARVGALTCIEVRICVSSMSKHVPSVSVSHRRCIRMLQIYSFCVWVYVSTIWLFSPNVSVILRYELRMRYLPKGYLSHFSEDKPSLNYLYHQVRQHSSNTE